MSTKLGPTHANPPTSRWVHLTSHWIRPASAGWGWCGILQGRQSLRFAAFLDIRSNNGDNP